MTERSLAIERLNTPHLFSILLDVMPVRCCGLVTCLCVIVGLWKKNYMKKNCCNPQCFQGKNYKAKFLTRLILKKLN